MKNLSLDKLVEPAVCFLGKIFRKRAMKKSQSIIFCGKIKNYGKNYLWRKNVGNRDDGRQKRNYPSAFNIQALKYLLGGTIKEMMEAEMGIISDTKVVSIDLCK